MGASGGWRRPSGVRRTLDARGDASIGCVSLVSLFKVLPTGIVFGYDRPSASNSLRWLGLAATMPNPE